MEVNNDEIVYIKNKHITKEYNIYLDSNIDVPDKYRKIMNTIREATGEDIIILRINSNGGNFDTMIQIYNELINTKAKTKSIIYNAYSAGGILALSCDDIEVSEFASMMIHQMQINTCGGLNEVANEISMCDNIQKKLFEKIFKGFLTNKQIENIFIGKVMWLETDEIKRRLNKWTPIRKRKEE